MISHFLYIYTGGCAYTSCFNARSILMLFKDLLFVLYVYLFSVLFPCMYCFVSFHTQLSLTSTFYWCAPTSLVALFIILVPLCIKVPLYLEPTFLMTLVCQNTTMYIFRICWKAQCIININVCTETFRPNLLLTLYTQEFIYLILMEMYARIKNCL